MLAKVAARRARDESAYTFTSGQTADEHEGSDQQAVLYFGDIPTGIVSAGVVAFTSGSSSSTRMEPTGAGDSSLTRPQDVPRRESTETGQLPQDCQKVQERYSYIST